MDKRPRAWMAVGWTRAGARRSSRQPGVWDTGKRALGASVENSSCRTTHKPPSLLATSLEAGAPMLLRGPGERRRPVSSLEPSPTLLDPNPCSQPGR